jgi:hypothetical protein
MAAEDGLKNVGGRCGRRLATEEVQRMVKDEDYGAEDGSGGKKRRRRRREEDGGGGGDGEDCGAGRTVDDD